MWHPKPSLCTNSKFLGTNGTSGSWIDTPARQQSGKFPQKLSDLKLAENLWREMKKRVHERGARTPRDMKRL